jgi:hypothetical protein
MSSPFHHQDDGWHVRVARLENNADMCEHFLHHWGGHYMAAMIPHGSRDERAFSDFTVARMPLTLYALRSQNGRHDKRDFPASYPGLEIAWS